MIIHFYFTNGMSEWAEVFLKSFKYFNGEEIPIIFDTKDLTISEIKKIESLYKNLEIFNSKLDINKLSYKLGIKKEVLLNYKEETEKNKVNPENKVWKLMIAGDDRIKTVRKRLNEMNREDILLHFDIDIIFISKINNLYNSVKNNDFSTIFRIDQFLDNNGNLRKEKEVKATAIGVQGYTKNTNGLKFIDKWINYIDDIHPIHRKKGYAQAACYYAYKDLKNEMKIGNLKEVSNCTIDIATGMKNKAVKKFKNEINNWK